MLDYENLIAFRPPEVRTIYSAKEVILYALAVGAGADLPSGEALPFVYEKGLRPLPSFYNILCWPTNRWLHDLGLDMSRLVHGGERVEIVEPVSPGGETVTRYTIGRVSDRGIGKGLVVEAVARVHAADDDRLLARSVSALFAMGDGGLAGAPKAEPTRSKPLPDRAPDGTVEIATRPDQAALYRLCGDMNPIHIDPEAAARLGLERPLLHGLCTLGCCVHAMARRFPALAKGPATGFEARFRAPVFPGETLTVDHWEVEDGLRFEARVVDRPVLTGGAIRFVSASNAAENSGRR